jgi:hypothetical protein
MQGDAVSGRCSRSMPGRVFGQGLGPAGISTLLLVACLSACNWKGGASNQPAGASPAASKDVWRSVPTSIRISSSSRFVRRDKGLLLEARVEAADEMGDTTKATGTLQFEVVRVKSGGSKSLGERLYQWEVKLLNIDDQRGHYDAVLRAYLFELSVDDMPANVKRVLLRATLHVQGGPRLIADAQIPVTGR